MSSALIGHRRASPSGPPDQAPYGVGCLQRPSREHRRPAPRLRVRPFPATIDPAGTTASADFSTASNALTGTAVPPSGHPWRPPRIRTATFPAHPPRLRNGLLMATGFAVLGRLAQADTPSTRFVYLRSRVRLGLPSHPASRRRSCLRLVVRAISPTGDSHPQAAAHAGRTRRGPVAGPSL